jgi:hypothetical protein
MKIFGWLLDVVCKRGNTVESVVCEESESEPEPERQYASEEIITTKNAKSVTRDMIKRVDRLNQKIGSIVDLM